METLTPLSHFFTAIQNDGRISISHIGVFAALLQFRISSGNVNPIQAYSYDIMKLGKISTPTTYHKCIKQLSEYGYIKYEPSKKRNRGSKIYFTEAV